MCLLALFKDQVVLNLPLKSRVNVCLHPWYFALIRCKCRWLCLASSVPLSESIKMNQGPFSLEKRSKFSQASRLPHPPTGKIKSPFSAKVASTSFSSYIHWLILVTKRTSSCPSTKRTQRDLTARWSASRPKLLDTSAKIWLSLKSCCWPATFLMILIPSKGRRPIKCGVRGIKITCLFLATSLSRAWANKASSSVLLSGSSQLGASSLKPSS